MQANKKIFSFLAVSALAFLLAGCPAFRNSMDVALKPDPSKQHNSSSMSKRFQDAAPKGQTATDSAIELSKRYAKLSEETIVLRQKNQEFIAENCRLKDRLAVLEPELKQTKKELAEANDLLIEMRIELNNWKTNILGFRDEMRDADKAQLEALLKILKVLGGEVKTELPQKQNQDLTMTSPKAQSKPRPKEIPISGESNE